MSETPRESAVPTIDDVKAVQARYELDDHVVWVGPKGFVVAHTDEERASIDLQDCDLHRWLEGLGGPPDVAEVPGYYVALPHEPDADSEDYGTDPWDFERLDIERDELEALSLGWEASSGADSIATIERVYMQTPSGAYVCVYPGCSFSRRDAAALWRHVHTAHGENGLPPDGFDPGPWL